MTLKCRTFKGVRLGIRIISGDTRLVTRNNFGGKTTWSTSKISTKPRC